MFFRIVIVANFDKAPSNARIQRVIGYLNENAINVNVGQPNPELTRARLEVCRHDDIPNQPCTLVLEYTLDTPPA